MLRSPITPNRTEVHRRPDMKQTTTRRLPPTPTALARSPTPRPTPKTVHKLTTGVRLFED
jgi:hypothetical protein